jgi:hypothetical protein
MKRIFLLLLFVLANILSFGQYNEVIYDEESDLHHIQIVKIDEAQTNTNQLINVKTPIVFTSFAIGWKIGQEISPAEITIRYRVHKPQKGWTEWKEDEAYIHPNETRWQMYQTDLLFGLDEGVHDSIQFYYYLPSGIISEGVYLILQDLSPQLKYNSDKSRNNDVITLGDKSTCPEFPTIIPRSSWCGSYSACQNPTYTPTYISATHTVIHHGASPDSYTDGAAVVRSYWNYHVNTNGWSDIGYNYLFDKSGNMYQGRYNPNLPNSDVKGAHAGSANSKSIGLNYLGNSDASGTAPTTAQNNKCCQFMAWWYDHKGLDPTSSASILCQDNVTRTLKRICGHRDVNPGGTTCPGNALYALLPTLRTNTQQIIEACNTSPTAPTNLTTTLLGCPENEVKFSWQNSGTGWFIQVSTSSSFPQTSSYIKWVSGLTTYTGPTGFVLQSDGTTPLTFQSSTTYYWRIYYGSSNYTTTYSFTTLACSSVPANLSATILGCPDNEVKFQWQNSGTGWYIQVSTSSSFPQSSSYIKWVSGLTTYTGPTGFVLQSDNTTPLGSFLSNTLYYWRIYYGSGNYTTTKTFTTPNCNPPNITVNANPSTICSGQSTTLTASGASTYSWSHSLGSGASKTVTPTATTTYSVTGTGSNNATNSALILITVNDCSTTQPTNLSTTLLGCPDNQVTFTWQNSGTGWYIQVSTDPAFPQSNSYIKWVSGLTTYTGPANFVLQSDGITLLDHFQSNTTYYWRIYYGSGNYTNTNSFTTLDCDPVLQISISADQLVICNGQSAILSASGADSYEWSNNLGTNATITVSPATTTTYSVTGTSNGQSASANITITVNQTPSLTIIATPNEVCLGNPAILNVSGANSYIWSNGLGTNSTVNVTPSTSTIYSVTGTTNNCSSSATIFVEVLQPPTIGTATINTNIICQNDAITLLLSDYSINDILQWQISTDGNNWNNIPSANVSPFNYSVNTIGNVYFRAQVSNNCGSVISNILTILSNPIPNTPTITQISNNPIILQSNAPTGNQWYKNNNPITGATNQTYIVTENGTYHTIVTINGCHSLPSNQITINNVGINDYSDDEIFIYPNPAQNIIYIQSNKPIIEANIINNLGQLVATSEQSNSIEVNNLSNGIYQLIIKTNDNIIVKPVLISK